MARVAYVNGRYVPFAQAKVHVEDRGFQFADGVYEVVALKDGNLVDCDGHVTRLERSLRELRMVMPLPRRVLELVMREMMHRNQVNTGLLYLQVTRGAARRDFGFPRRTAPTLVITVRPKRVFVPETLVDQGIRVITIPDIRWKRRDIKSVALLPQVLGKQRAIDAGAFEAWQVDDHGYVTEGCSSNAWIVTTDGTLVTRHADNEILNGITRLSILDLAKAAGFGVQIRPFTVEEAHNAREAFMTSASTFVLPITRIDDRPIGDGRPGPLGQQLRQAYIGLADGRST